MIAVIVNTFAVLVGSIVGILFRSRLNENLRNAVMKALGLCTALIGFQSALGTNALLCVIFCMVLGTVLGELLRIDDRLEHLADRVKAKIAAHGIETGSFTEGFVSSCILFCIGSMTIMGSLEAGIRHNYTIIYAKSLMDLMSSMAFGAAMGFGVTCSALFVLLFQGALTLLASWIGAALSSAVVTEMSAVGGVILVGMAINLLGLSESKLKVANMLPAIFLPILYIPVVNLF